MEGSNFAFLKDYDPLLLQLAVTAERSFVPDPNTTLIKLRQLAEALAQEIAARVGIETDPQTRQLDLLRDIDQKLRLDRNANEAFHQIRRLGNKATHDFSSSTHRDALKALQIAWALSTWFFRTFGGDNARAFKPPAFTKPQDPSLAVRAMEERIRALESESQRTTERLKVAEALHEAEAEKAEAERLRAEQIAADSEIWEQLAQEHEMALVELRREFESKAAQKTVNFLTLGSDQQRSFYQSVEASAFNLSEADTRVLIDEQLEEAGWEADSDNLTYAKGARPEPSRYKAIAEWPTQSGPADYVLFDGMTPVGVIEAKRKAKNVYSAIDQAKRYAEGFDAKGVCESTLAGDKFRIPLVFATNGRPYLKQLEQESGIWFLDVREQTNRRRALHGWFRPSELRNMLVQDVSAAEEKLKATGFEYDLALRPYQIEAIQAVEQSIEHGDQRALVAMATGTGKTKTCIALVYRLLKARRFRRVLFLVDRSALGEQAANAFNETRMENLQTFADSFDLKVLADKSPDDDTKVQIATVQGMVKRVLYPGEEDKPSVGQYDCIVVDECHRGYLLDRELSDTELQFRDQADYVSKYRAVIEYFDAYKVGLTATPALHTTDIFGDPVYSYSYTEAVIDGYLVDHLPPIRIKTRLAEDGIHYQVNEEVQLYDVATNQIELFKTPDELDFDVAQFNRNVINRNFNRAVIAHLIENDLINPYQPAKTLVFCVTDKHADMVVELFKEVCDDYLGGVEDDAIQKITGQSDKPLVKIRHYKNDRLPNIAVTVDLLTTGIDVPEICNLVFIRRVNSRILFEQMLGRATRRCDDLAKETFRIFDAVDIYKKLEKVNSMKPVATDPGLTFAKLENELIQADKPELQQLAQKQFVAKLQRKKRHLLSDKEAEFERIAGQSPADFCISLKKMPLEEIAAWFTAHPGLGEILDAKVGDSGGRAPIVISDHEDEVIDVAHGYGDGQKPEDYLQSFAAFINANSNRLPALLVVIQRPWELTRQSLKELAVELDRNQFREQDLRAAWKEAKNEDIAARIIGFIRQAALGEALVPWEDRVDQALARILASKDWKTPQKDWLTAIAKQMKANIIVDVPALNQEPFTSRFGGIRRANKLFDGDAESVLSDFNHTLWAAEDQAG